MLLTVLKGAEFSPKLPAAFVGLDNLLYFYRLNINEDY